MSLRNWNSPWFQIARRFFLYGSSKEFNIVHNEVDRIVDFIIVMESILVPEDDGSSGSRLRRRAVAIIDDFKINQNNINKIISDFYKVRNIIVHGGNVSSQHDILKKNYEFETIVRKVIIEAIRRIPVGAENRKTFLKQLFDVGPRERSSKVYNDFCAIKDINEEKKCFDLISKRLRKSGFFTENGKQKTENSPS
jgi:hypothetical protein